MEKYLPEFRDFEKVEYIKNDRGGVDRVEYAKVGFIWYSATAHDYILRGDETIVESNRWGYIHDIASLSDEQFYALPEETKTKILAMKARVSREDFELRRRFSLRTLKNRLAVLLKYKLETVAQWTNLPALYETGAEVWAAYKDEIMCGFASCSKHAKKQIEPKEGTCDDCLLALLHLIREDRVMCLPYYITNSSEAFWENNDFAEVVNIAFPILRAVAEN